MTRQVKSKQRVVDHGEVFTADREVNAMLDLVKNETERIESRFLEPACGEGAFLVKVLERKLGVVKAKYKKCISDYEKYSILALTSIYGVDIQQDNVEACQNRLYECWNNEYKHVCKRECRGLVREAAQFILKCNILCGDALTMLKSNGEPIVFAQWDLTVGTKLKRKDYQLDYMLKDEAAKATMKAQGGQQMTLDMLTNDEWEYDKESDTYVRGAIAQYKQVDFWEVQNNVEPI